MEDYLKAVYGQVNTPESLICEMYNLIPDEIKKDGSKKWLDPGCGTGVYSSYILDRLSSSLNKTRDNIFNLLKKFMIDNNL